MLFYEDLYQSNGYTSLPSHIHNHNERTKFAGILNTLNLKINLNLGFIERYPEHHIIFNITCRNGNDEKKLRKSAEHYASV